TDESFVTLVTNNQYGVGALILALSLKEVKTSRMLSVIVTDKISRAVVERLRTGFDFVFTVNELNSNDAANLAILQRPELDVTLTKILAWGLTQFRKCCFMDADTLVISNVDDIFQREELSAAPEVGWPDCFNSGVFVFLPSKKQLSQLTTFAKINRSFDGGDQGLLNMFFNDWATANIKKHLTSTFPFEKFKTVWENGEAHHAFEINADKHSTHVAEGFFHIQKKLDEMIAPQKANYKENIEDYRTLNIEDEIFYDNTLAVTLCYQGFLTKEKPNLRTTSDLDLEERKEKIYQSPSCGLYMR
ncbi:glycogenin-1-like, partial [Zophobas morio]|uniref:glycogenin-1-like n=1 Tax=Zophobas morio TaxID=2755281 RepID=UPI0030836E0F